MTVSFHGRQVDPVALWSNYVDFPEGWEADSAEEFAPLVQCPNPDHQTEKRHFQVNLKNDLVHCFAHCGISGTYENAISMIEGSTTRAARKKILMHSRVGMGDKPTVRKKSRKVAPVLDNTYERFLPQTAQEFLEKRGISESSLSKWELGWDMDALRIVIPAFDERGRISFLIRRTVKPHVEPRYLYPKGAERESLLFGACHIDPGMVGSTGLILVEGSIDTMIQHQHQLNNTVGILGSYLSEIQAKKIMNLRPPRIFTMFDADGAGIEATFSVRKRLPMIPHFVCRYPRGKTDPAELTQEEAHRSVKRAISMSRFAARVGRRF